MNSFRTVYYSAKIHNEKYLGYQEIGAYNHANLSSSVVLHVEQLTDLQRKVRFFLSHHKTMWSHSSCQVWYNTFFWLISLISYGFFTLVLFVVFTIFVQGIIVNWQWSKVVCCWHHHQVRRFFCHFKDWLEQCMFPWVCSFQTEISKKMMYNILMLRAKLSFYTKCHDFS